MPPISLKWKSVMTSLRWRCAKLPQRIRKRWRFKWCCARRMRLMWRASAWDQRRNGLQNWLR